MLSREQRVALGKSAREKLPRKRHAEYAIRRRDPIVFLEEQERTRIPELVPIRHQRMLQTPFTFFRGAALIMAADLAPHPRTSIRAQLCGDAHPANFGVFGTPERKLIFDVNDFDETHPGPWEWDIKRLAASFEVAARTTGISKSHRRTIVTTLVRSYREAMIELANAHIFDVWYAQIDAEEALSIYRKELEGRALEQTKEEIEKARTRDNVHAFEKLTEKGRIVHRPPVVVPVRHLPKRERFEEPLRAILQDYASHLQTDRRMLFDAFRVVDFARKVSGVGSVGTRSWIALMLGTDDDPLFLQIKEALPSVLERFTKRCAYENQGERVVAGQRLMQASSDVLLGWTRAKGIHGRTRDFYVRQLRDWKGSFSIEEMDWRTAQTYGRLCGRALARAHARSGDRIAIAAYLGKRDIFDDALNEFAHRYADQTELDWKAFKAAVRSGRLKA